MFNQSGIALAIDDFSMGKTSLQYLYTNRFQYVKLDGSLVRKLPENPRSREIVGSITALGESLGFRVVAEWVESEAIRDCLLRLNCPLFQGPETEFAVDSHLNTANSRDRYVIVRHFRVQKLSLIHISSAGTGKPGSESHFLRPETLWLHLKAG